MTWVRARALLCALVVMVVVPRAAQAAMSAPERAVLDQVNAFRASQGLPRLKPDPRLARAAAAHSTDMARHAFFAHESSDGTLSADRIRRFRRATSVGEVLAFSSTIDPAGPASVVSMWRASPPHVAVMSVRGYRRAGVARRVGRLAGARAVFWTMDFSSRR